jgi:ATP-binding cassette subfamily B protein/ATP-binding cassette subfamily C protein
MNIPLKQYVHLLADYLKPQQRRVIWLAITLLGSIALQLLNPQILGYFIDTAVAGGASQTLFIAALLFISVAIVTQILAVSATYLGENVAWTATNALRVDLVEHCLNLDLSFHKSRTPGELVERVDGDVNTLSRFFSQFTLHVLGNLILLFGILVVLFYKDWRACFCLSVFALTALTVLVRFRAYAIPPWVRYRQISAEFFGFLGEHLVGTEDLRPNGAISYVMRRFYQLLQRWLPVFHQARLASTVLWTASVGLFGVGNAMALTIGAYLWKQNAISIGTVYLIFYYTNLLSQPIERIREELENLQQAEASILRIRELLQVQSKISLEGNQPLPEGALSVAFDNVSFGYEGEWEREELALKDILFYLPSSQVLGLLGRTGSGKSTLARLLLRLYDPQTGSIRLGDIALPQTPLADLPHRIGLVTQDVQLFQTTVRNNLTFFDSQITDVQILDALEVLGLSTWLHSLPLGLDTLLGADSSGLSAGQAQLLAFARVFLKNPGLVILDEASSVSTPKRRTRLRML